MSNNIVTKIRLVLQMESSISYQWFTLKSDLLFHRHRERLFRRLVRKSELWWLVFDRWHGDDRLSFEPKNVPRKRSKRKREIERDSKAKINESIKFSKIC